MSEIAHVLIPMKISEWNLLSLKHLATVLWSLGTVGWRGAIP